MLHLAQIEQVRIGGRNLRFPSLGRISCDAIGETHCSILPVIVTSSQETGSESGVGIDRESFGEAELGHVESGFFWIGAHDPDQMIEHLCHTDGSEPNFVAPIEQRCNFGSGGLVLQMGEHRERIEDDHARRRRSLATSSVRALRRAASVSGPLPAYFPRRAFTGSSGRGRTTT